MTTILLILLYLLLIIVTVYNMYFLITSLFAFKKKKTPHNHNYKENFFSILIPARNEEEVIGNLLKSLKKLNYNKDKYEINVVLNNCTDNTYTIAKNENVNVIKCKNKIKSKGDALKEVFNTLKDRNIDAYVIFDADNIVDSDFLKYMNESLNNGYKVAQGFRELKNKKNNWLSYSYALYYYIQNFFFNEARKKCKSSSSINGTGLMIKKEVIDKIGFNTKTLTEDLEFTGICALNNIKIDYVDKAITYDEEPTSLIISFIQRIRWIRGDIDCLKNYYKLLINKIISSKSKEALDCLFIYLAPITNLFSTIVFILTLIIKDSFRISLISFALITLLSYTICTFLLIHYNKKILHYLSGIVMFPIFLLTWTPITMVSLFNKKIEWKHISHKEKIQIEEIHHQLKYNN